MSDLAKQEHNQWTAVCAQLRVLGAVTDEDLKSSVRDASTPGRQLLIDLLAWGSLRVRLETEAEEEDAQARSKESYDEGYDDGFSDGQAESAKEESEG